MTKLQELIGLKMGSRVCRTVLLSLPLLSAMQGVDELMAQAPKPSGYSQEAFVFEERTTQITFANDGTSEQKGLFRVRVQSDAGVQALGVVTIPYEQSTQQVDIDYVRVRKPDGTVVPTPTDDMQDVEAEITRQAPMYSDQREKHLAVKGLGPGDVLEYQARWHTAKPMAPGHFWLTYDFVSGAIILRDQLSISVPRDRAVKWKSEGYKPVITEAGASRTYEWTHAQLTRKSADEEKKEQASTARETATGKLPQPDIQLSSFATWAEVGQWYGGLQTERVKPTPEIRAKAAELTKGMTDDDAKARAIYHYVSTQFRYIGIDFGVGRYQPHAAGEVLANHYGDCKDKHTLLAAMLESLNIQAYPALINSSRDIDAAVPSPGQFDHVVTVVPRGDHLMWLDTTPEVAPFGYLMTTLRDKRALAIGPNQEAALVTTPARPISLPVDTFRIDAKLNAAGTMEGKIERTLAGDDAEIIVRSAFRRTAAQQWKELAQQLSFASGFAGEVSEVNVSSTDKLDAPFALTYNYLRKDYVDPGNKRVGMPVPPLGLPEVPDSDAGTPSPIWLGPPAEYRYESHIELPKGEHPGLPKILDIDKSFGEYHVAYEFKDGELIGHRHLVVKLEEVPVESLPAYKKFRLAVQNSQDLTIPLASGPWAMFSYQEEIWNLPPSDNADAVKAYGEAQEDFKKGDIEAQIKAIKHAVELDPGYTRAWLWLGEVYKTRNQPDSAIAAYREAIRIDPGQSVSYKALGLELMAVGKFTEAAAAARELIRVAPDDLVGHSLLSGTLFALKQCREAADEYEAAARIAPELGTIQFGLADSQVCAGDMEKSVAPFIKAAELDPTPPNLNNVAYRLTFVNKGLDSALMFATKAVADATAASRKIDLSALEKKDLGPGSALEEYWDTLGWVYFRMGKWAPAEEYLKAAWMLSQSAVIADHLAQVYEKTGNKEEALHMYRLALKCYLSGPGGIAKTRERMEKLSPGSSTLGPKDEQATVSELSQMRTVKLPHLTAETANADFIAVFARDPKTGAAKIEGARFIGGSEVLKNEVAAVQSAKFPMALPADGQARILRRGVVGCFPVSGCSFTLLNTGDVHSVN